MFLLVPAHLNFLDKGPLNGYCCCFSKVLLITSVKLSIIHGYERNIRNIKEGFTNCLFLCCKTVQHCSYYVSPGHVRN